MTTTQTTINAELAAALLAHRKAKRKLKRADNAQSRAAKLFALTGYDRHTPQGRNYRDAQANYKVAQREEAYTLNEVVAQIDGLFSGLTDKELKQIAEAKP